MFSVDDPVDASSLQQEFQPASMILRQELTVLPAKDLQLLNVRNYSKGNVMI